jgi:hypothetical protein
MTPDTVALLGLSSRLAGADTLAAQVEENGGPSDYQRDRLAAARQHLRQAQLCVSDAINGKPAAVGREVEVRAT